MFFFISLLHKKLIKYYHLLYFPKFTVSFLFFFLFFFFYCTSVEPPQSNVLLIPHTFFLVTCNLLCVKGSYSTCMLFQTIQYMAHSKVLQTETRELASLSRGKIRPGESDEWKNEQLYVPPLPPTNLRGCHLIKIQYDVYVSNVG